MIDEVELRGVVTAVRERMEAADLSGAHVCFQSFPEGACGGISDVLATILERRFGVVPVWVSATLGEGTDFQSHAWLEVEGFTIDITADQFGERPVIVAPASSWHQALEVDQRVHYPPSQRNWEIGRTVWHLVADLAVAG